MTKPKKKYQHGLMVARLQPFHLGHAKVLDAMLLFCQQVSVVIGSIQESRTFKNPLTYDERKNVLLQYLAEKHPNQNTESRVLIVGQADINDDDSWSEVVLANLAQHYQQREQVFVPVDAYFSGSPTDSHWYVDYIANIEIIDRQHGAMAGVSATKIRQLYCQGDDSYLKWLPTCSLPTLEHIVCKE